MDISTVSKSLRYAFGIGIAVAAIGATNVFAHTDVTVENDTTGPSSIQETIVDETSNTEITITRVAEAENDIAVSFDTSGGVIMHNTTVGDVATGDVVVRGAFDTELNTGSIASLTGWFGDDDVTVHTSNDTTGPNSSQVTEVNVENNNTLDLNQEANIENNIAASLTTSTGVIRHNTTVGNVRGGDINFNVSSDNKANTGSLNLGAMFNGSNDVTVHTSNDTTGPNSENSTEVNVENNTEINVEQQANIDNNVEISATTNGGNIHNNTTVGDVSTGSINVDLSFNNSAN